MGKPVELVPLVCIRCSTPIPAEPDQTAWVCQNCGQGMRLDELQGLLPLEVFYSAALQAAGAGKPFWVAQGRVTLRRDSFKDRSNQDREAQLFWNQPRVFCIPAFNCQLDFLLTSGTRSIEKPPDLQQGPPVPFEPVVLSLEDVRASAEYIIMGIEAARPDKLRKVTFDLKLEEPALWILPNR